MATEGRRLMSSTNGLTRHYTDDTDARKDLSAIPVKFVSKIFAALLLFGLAATPAVHAQREKLPPADLEFVQKTWPDAKKTSTGIRYIIQHEGQGDSPKAGDRVFV